MITPEYINKLINFYPGTKASEWKFNSNAVDMRNLQIKGTARIYNILNEHKIALLADEVGMGKTIQSLAVISALLHKNPNARILILAPRNEIAKNWEKEYLTFVRHHYRHHDNIIKTAIGGEPVRKMVNCTNLFQLTHEVKQGWGQIFIGKISSFSSLLSKKEVSKRLLDLGINDIEHIKKLNSDNEINKAVAHLLRKEIMKYSNVKKSYFDLVIIDEAHYFRHKDGDSFRANAATMFFGNPDNEQVIPIAEKVLLLTATPNHSKSEDISNIVSYFTSFYKTKTYKEILDTLCIRRLRRLGTHSQNKYNYRQEIESESNFNNNPLSELFFALYQHELVKKVNQQEQGKKTKGGGASRILKYLEGVEFIPTIQTEKKELADKENINTDFNIGSDTEILIEMSKEYHKIFDTNPSHPKYDKLVSDLTGNHTEEKALVFVRRIASVFEIARRVLHHHDEKMWSLLADNESTKIPLSSLDRALFNTLNKPTEGDTNHDEIEESEDIIDINGSKIDSFDVEKKNMPISKMLNLFKIIKNDPVVRTDAANFRLRFNASKPGIYGMFFSPGANYFEAPYSKLISHRFTVGTNQLENYYTSAFKHRTDLISDNTISKDLQSILMPKQPVGDGEKRAQNIETLFTIFWEIYQNDKQIDTAERQQLKTIYLELDYYEREALSNFIEKGTLLASEAIIWMYKAFRSLQINEESQIEHYTKFINQVKSILPTTRLYKQIQESILHFKTIYSKVFCINNYKDLLEYSWDSFNNAQPIYPYNADNSSKSVLNSFNTPFFPDILVATSILQEGVNLQYFCKTIYHYGMAWTPGDNEQRIGRIDRMFGKIERDLNQNKKSVLPIYYPYLKNTVDEEHLAKFVKKKYREETLIDLGKSYKEDGNFSMEDSDHENWREYLRTEPSTHEISDPYPAEKADFKNINPIDFNPPKIDYSPLFHSIINAIKELNLYTPEFHLIQQTDNFKIIVDPTLTSGRKQPVVIEAVFDPIGTGYLGEAIYCLRMKTPITALTNLRDFKDKFYSDETIQNSYSHGIKLCLDNSQTGGSLWGVYFAAELPLFLSDLNDNPLSKDEVKIAFKNLIECADLTERGILSNQDLQLEALNIAEDRKQIKSAHELRKAKKAYSPKWEISGDYYVKRETHNKAIVDILKYTLSENHNNFYVKCLPDVRGNSFKNNKCFQEVSYLKLDSQKKEITLLEQHLKVARNKFGN